jgi:hypothetical protein
MSGNGNGGTWSGTPAGVSSTYYASGKVGLAGVFDGSSTYVITANTSSVPSSNSSRSGFAWILYTGTGTAPYYVISYGTTVTAEACRLYVDGYPNGAKPTLYFEGVGDDFHPTFTLTLNAWHFVGYTYNGGTSITVYYDGQSQTGSLSGGLPLNTVLTSYLPYPTIGKSTNGLGGYFPGLIDDVRIYNRALSASEIQALYNAEK